MQRFAIFAICLLQIALSACGEGHYTVIGPGTLHSAHKYNVAVAVHDTEQPCQLKVGITGPSYNETKLVEIKSANEVQLLEFDVPELKRGDYNLTTEGVSGIIFHNTTRLNYNLFEPYVLIQTDKGVYKPGDVVQFRVIFMDENLKPAVLNKAAIVWFEDAKRNRIKEYKSIDVVKGVYTDKFEISEYPVLGTWRIMVQTGETVNKQVSFKVDKYVLPKFVVKVEATENVAVQDGDMQVVVRANYTYGKPVNGKVTLLLEVHSWSYEHHRRADFPSLIKTADMVNGKAKFDLNVKEYETKLEKKATANVNVIATIEEEFTGVKLNGTASSNFYPYRYKIHCESWETCSTYHPNEAYEVVMQILHVDGSLPKPIKPLVRLTYTEKITESWWDPDKPKPSTTPIPPTEELKHFEFETHLNASGMAVFKVMLPDLAEIEGYQHYFTASIEFEGQTDETISTYQYRESKQITPIEQEEPKDYLHLNVDYEPQKYDIKIGAEATVTINSSVPLAYFVYTIVGRGNVQKVERVELPEKQKVYKLKFVPTFEMAPFGRIYVHYVEDGVLHYQETSFNVDWELQNKIEIDVPEQVKVGEDVALTIKTEPHSFVGLLGIDQSVLLLRANNGIQENSFRWKLGQYLTRTPNQGGYSYYPGDKSGLVTLTNANYFYNWTSPWQLRGVPEMLDDNVNGVKHSVILNSVPSSGKVGYSGHVAPMSHSGASNPAVRKDFAETWIFANIENTESEKFTWKKKIPDTITSWIITAFSMSPEKGIATTQKEKSVRTFQPFFISIRLPYSVKRGEVIAVPALVFNYLEKDLDVEVTLENTDKEFEFTEVTNEVIDAEKRSKMVRVPANSAKGVSFLLRPKVIGNMMLKFKAVSPVAGDAIHKTLKVVPEGITEYANRAFFVNLKDATEFKETFALNLPSEIVPDSEHAEFAVVGDLLGPLLNNLQQLVRLPTGCGEQTMSKFVPNYLMMRYLKSINRLTSTREFEIRHNLERGYQSMLPFQHSDGSFSSFGPSLKTNGQPRNGSTWLTAYVMRFLQQADEYIIIDPKVITFGLAYLASTQAANGSFPESGDFFYRSQNNEVSLTASVMLAFVEHQKHGNDYANNLEKGAKFILENIGKTEDVRAKALAVFTLLQIKHPMAAQHLADLKALAKTDGDRMWWMTTEKNDQFYNIMPWWRWPHSNAVETTSYVMLSLLDQATETQSVLPILTWLVAQRNSFGGFASTQDTVVGLQALIKFAEKSGYEAAEMSVGFKSQGGTREKSETIKIDEENALLMQNFELPEKTNAVDIHAQGKGAALVQVSYQYNIYEKEKTPSFTIDYVLNAYTPLYKMEMEVCVKYVGENGASNMAILDIALPSGYVADVDSFEELAKGDRIRHVESKNEDTAIVVYFESLRKDDMKCVSVEAFKSYGVAMQKPSPIVVYDYYDTTKKATNYYKVDVKICGICDREEEECKKLCG